MYSIYLKSFPPARRLLACVVVVLSFFVAGTGVAVGGDSEKKRFEKFTDIDGLRIGVLSGTLFDYLVNATLDHTQLFYYSSMNEMIRALLKGDLDSIVDDEPSLRFLASQNSRLSVIPDSVMEYRYGFLFGLKQNGLVKDFNAELQKLLEGGAVDAMCEKWMSGEGGPTADSERYSGTKLVRLGVLAESPPFAYRDMQNNVIGLDVELVETICRNLDYRLEVTAMGMDQLFDSLQEDKIDAMVGSIAITDEREQLGIFTIPYQKGGVVAVVAAEK